MEERKPVHEADLRGRHAFPSTRWSQLAVGPDGGSVAGRRALETLARRYWLPIAAYVRVRFARSDDEAREATQAFFLWAIERGLLARLDPERGSFRGFVKRALANFLHDRARERRSEKRGGGRVALALDDGEGGLRPIPDPRGRGAEELLDDLWREALLAQAAEELEAELRAAGKELVFRVFRDYYLGEEELDYATVAARHGVTTVDVSNWLQLAKKRYRARLRAAVLETVQGDDELRAELAWLLAEGGA